jgi:drug/metabolite transporter (DMT)-like permease
MEPAFLRAVRNTSAAHLALFAVNLIYGANYVVAKALLPAVVPPSGFVLLRVLGAGILFWCLWATHRERVPPADLSRLALCGLFGVAVNQLLFFHGLSATSPLHASLLMVATPILVLVISGVLLGERLLPGKVIGVLLGAVGAVSLLLWRDGTEADGSTPRGDLFILANAIAFGIFLVVAKPLLAKYRADTVMAWSFLFGSLVVVPFGAGDLLALDWSGLHTFHWWAIAFVVVLVTFVAYLLNTWALRHVNPGVVGTYIYLQPVLAIAFGWAFQATRDALPGLGAPSPPAIGIATIVAAAAIFTGVHLVNRADRN